MSFKGIGLRLPVIVVAFCITICFLLIVILPGVPEAGLYHSQGDAYNNGAATIACSQCHTMHGVQGGNVNSLIYGGEVTTYPALLRAASALELCLYCHDGNNAGLSNPKPPDVMGTILTEQSAPSAGNFAHGGYANDNNRHDIGVDMSTTLPPGYDDTGAAPPDWAAVRGKFGNTFNCLYCHDNHGNSNYRNLRYDPGNPSSDNRTSGDRVDITYTYAADEAAAWTYDNTTNAPMDTDIHNWSTNTTSGSAGEKLEKYERNNVRFRRKPVDNDGRGISAWCGKCHVDFYGISGDANIGGFAAAGEGDGDSLANPNPWVRHPVADISIEQGGATGNVHGDATNLDLDKVRAVDAEYPNGTTGNEQPLCLSCHYAHGGGNPNRPPGDNTLDHSNLVFLDNEGDFNILPTVAEGGAYSKADGMLRNLCQQCHNQ